MNRTLKQNASLHKWLEQVAEALDEAGHDMRVLIKVPIRPNKENVKEEIVRPVMLALYGTERWKDPEHPSTTELETDEIVELYDHLNRAFGEKLGIHVHWPCKESLSEAQR